jgi:spermidine synthase
MHQLGEAIDVFKAPGVPVRVVHLGGAAMALPRYVAVVRPRSRQVVLEPAAEVTELVRAELPLPRRSGIKVRPLDGRTGVGQLPDAYAELVVVDAFADARVPAALVTAEFFADVARVLQPHGQLLLNLTDRAPFAWTRRVIAGLRTIFTDLTLSAEPATLRGRRFGNLVVVAARDPIAVEALRERARMSGTPYRLLDSAQISDGFGGGRRFTDDDTEPSPPPDR